MAEKLLVDYINMYRHDLMNHLQLLQGYSQLDNVEKMKEVLAEILVIYEQERHLFQLNVDEFTLFLLFLHHHYPNMTMRFDIEAGSSELKHAEKKLVEQTKCFMAYFSRECDAVLFQWLLQIKYDKIKAETIFSFSVQEDKISHLGNGHNLILTDEHFPVSISKNDDRIYYSFAIADEL